MREKNSNNKHDNGAYEWELLDWMHAVQSFVIYARHIHTSIYLILNETRIQNNVLSKIKKKEFWLRKNKRKKVTNNLFSWRKNTRNKWKRNFNMCVSHKIPFNCLIYSVSSHWILTSLLYSLLLLLVFPVSF